jgi:hypothetical protein
MRSEPTIDELIISIKNFLESLNIEIFPNIKKNIKILNEINEIDELKINEIIDFINSDLINNLSGHDRNYASVARNSLQIFKEK